MPTKIIGNSNHQSALLDEAQTRGIWQEVCVGGGGIKRPLRNNTIDELVSAQAMWTQNGIRMPNAKHTERTTRIVDQTT